MTLVIPSKSRAQHPYFVHGKIVSEMSSAATQLVASRISVKPNDLFSSPAKRTLVTSLALILLTVVAYHSIGKNGFINFDDSAYIYENVHINSGFHWDIFTWAFGYHLANWHPLTWFSHALDCQLFGLNPSAHHFMGVLLHAMNAVLIFLLLQSVTGVSWRSVIVAALFAVHPLNVESVAWASERKNLLSMFFFLLALYAYVWYARKPQLVRYLTVAVLFVLSLMSKPQVITFPFVLLLLDYWPLRRMQLGTISAGDEGKSPTRLFLEKIPFLVLSAVSAVITMHAQRAGGAVRSMYEYSLRDRAENAVWSYLLYVRDIIFPRHLAPIYPHPVNSLCTNCSLEWWKVAGAAAVLLLISVLCGIGHRNRYFVVGWLWFVGTLIPMIGLVQVGTQGRADRYMYLPMVGILVAGVWGASDFVASHNLRRRSIAIACCLALIVLTAITSQQVGYWRNSETLWNYTLRVTDSNFMAEDNLAKELVGQGRITEALVHFHNTLRLYNWEANNLIAFGVYEQGQGYPADAIKQYERALQNTTDPTTRAIEFSNMGSAYMGLKDFDHARQCFEQALKADPKNTPALSAAGVLAEKRGDLELAIRQFTTLVSIKPSDLGYALLGHAFEQSGRTAEANDAYSRGKALSPDFQSARLAVDHMFAE